MFGLTSLGSDLITQGRYYQFMVRFQIRRAVNTGVQYTCSEITIDKDIVQHMPSSGTISIAVPSCQMYRLVLKPGVGNEQIIGGTKVKQERTIFIGIISCERTNNGFPMRRGLTNASIEVTQDNKHILVWHGCNNRL